MWESKDWPRKILRKDFGLRFYQALIKAPRSIA
jgi:hypothetical protein